MPTFHITAPSGKTYNITAPEGGTQQQALALAQRMEAQSAPAKPRGRIGIPVLDGLASFGDSVVSTGNEMLLGAAQGAENIGSFFTDPITRMIGGKDVLAQERQGRAGRWDSAGRALVSRPNPTARTIGQMAPAMAVPLARVPQFLGRAAPVIARGIQGAIGGAAVRDSNQGAAAPAAIGAAANMALPPVLRAAMGLAPVQAAGRMLGRAGAPLLSAADNAADAVLARVKPAMGLGAHSPIPRLPPAAPVQRTPLAPLGRKAEARAARFKALGVEQPTTGMVTRDPRAWTFEKEQAKAFGTGDDLARQMLGVEQGLAAKGRDLAAGAKGAEETGTGVQQALDAKRGEMQQVTSRLYERVRENGGDAVVGGLPGITGAIDDPVLRMNPKSDDIAEGVGRWVKRFGGDNTTVSQAEELRKLIGNLGSDVDPYVRKVRRDLIDTLDDDVVAAVGDDAFKAARASAKARFGEFSKTAAGKIADEGIAAEALTKRLFAAGTSHKDLRAVRQSLTSGTPEQVERGTEAWKAVQKQKLADMLTGPDGAITEDGAVQGGKLWRQFRSEAPKLRELLGPEDFKTLRRLAQASRDVTVAPPMSAVNYSNTASSVGNMLTDNPAVKKSALKLIAKHGIQHGAALLVAPGAGNIAVAVGNQVAGSVAASAAEQAAAQALMQKISLARSPEEMAAAVAAAQQAAQSNPAVADILQRLGSAIGGGAAAASGQ